MSGAKLHISEELALPREAVTSTFVVYGGKGMGKTNFGSVFAEELSRARLRFAVIDPMGVWWGLRHSADGHSPGIELLILGGVKGDMPIEPSGGGVVADLVADESVNVLIDISRHANGKMWSIGERIRFVRDYFVQLYARQGEQKRPLMQILDEAARFCPQMVRSGDQDVAQCLGAVAVMVEEGRNVGVGVGLLTQRSARLNKDVAELADCMISFRIVGPRSIDAVLDWFGEHIDKSHWKDLIEKLRKLPIGRALVVSPGWLEFEGEAQIRRRETFDSSATPKPGEKAKTPRGAAAKPDLGKYQERMAATIERAEANDPAKLRKQIVDLQRTNAELQRSAAKTPAVEKGKTQIKRVEVPVLGAKERQSLTRLEEKLSSFDFGQIRDSLSVIRRTLIDPGLPRVEDMRGILAKSEPPISRPQMQPVARPAMPAASRNVEQHAPSEGGDSLPPRRQRILDALLFFESISYQDAAREWIAFFCDTSPNSSTYERDCGGMRTSGLISYPNAGRLQLTAEGRSAARPTEPLTLGQFHEKVEKLLPPRRQKITRALIDVYPDALRRDQLAERIGTSVDSSTFERDLGGMRSAGLLTYPQANYARAAELLFPPLPA